MKDVAWGDSLGMLAWIAVALVVFLILVGLGKLLMWWLSHHPTISRVFVIAFSGLGIAMVAAIAATVVAFVQYGFRSGGKIWGFDRAAFFIGVAAITGFILGAVPAWLFVQRTLRMKQARAA